MAQLHLTKRGFQKETNLFVILSLSLSLLIVEYKKKFQVECVSLSQYRSWLKFDSTTSRDPFGPPTGCPLFFLLLTKTSPQFLLLSKPSSSFHHRFLEKTPSPPLFFFKKPQLRLWRGIKKKIKVITPPGWNLCVCVCKDDYIWLFFFFFS